MADEVKTRFVASDEVSPVIKAIGTSVEHLNKGLGMLNQAGSLIGLGIGITSVAAIGSYAVSSMNKAVSAYQGLEQQQTKLITVMRQRMGANKEMVASVNEAISAETRLGVVGGMAQRAGAQQVATFLTQASSINTLIPAMNNLAVQQHGYNATAQDMAGIANLMGKAMMGQTTALRRVGITMDDNQATLLKTLPEQERAALLAQIITQNVGEMNKAFAETPEGQKIQATNRLGAAWAGLGAKIAGTKSAIEAEFIGLQADTLNTWADALAVAFLVVANGVRVAVEALSWLASTVVQTAEVLAPFVAIGMLIYGTYEAIAFIMAAYGVITGTVATSTAALGAVETAYLGLMVMKETIVKAVTTAMALHRAGILMATVAQWALNAATLAFPGIWIAAIIAALVGAIAVLAAHTGNLQDVFSSVWGSIVYIVTGAINIIIDGLNLFIKAMNGAASLSNALFKTGFNPMEEIQHVSGQGANDLGNKFIYQGVKVDMPDMSSKLPEIATPPSIPGVTGPDDKDSENQRAIKDHLGKIATDTGRIADKIDMTDEEIKELRGLAEKDTTIRWQEQHITVEVNNDNKIASGIDVDGMTGDIVRTLRNALAQDREGVRA